jgi:SAM-dependent methyltransferase
MSFSPRLQRVVPPALKPLARAVYYSIFRFSLRIRLWLADRIGMPGQKLAVPPAILRFRVSETISAGEFLRVGEGCANLIQQCVRDLGKDFEGDCRVLDFGCGCGRTIRWFLRDGGNAEFHGVDVDAEAVAWCRQHLQQGHFLATGPEPPLPYPADHFDIVYCLSVFTHLNESMQDAWLAELARIMKPGGVLILTVYGKTAGEGLNEEGWKMLQSRGFVHQRSQKLKGLVPDWYQTTWHSREYIVNRLSARFEDIRYVVVPDGQQDVVAGEKSDPSELKPGSEPQHAVG